MVTTTYFKWETYVKQRVQTRLCWYLLHFVIASAAMVVSTQTSKYGELNSDGSQAVSDEAAMVADVLIVCMLLTNSLIVLKREIKQLSLPLSSVQEYLSDPWNMSDLGGIAALYVAAAAHFMREPLVLQQVGPCGVLLNSVSILQLLRPFDLTGPLIATVLEILVDIQGYLCILSILLIGFSVVFTVSMPDNERFAGDSSAGVAGPFTGLLTTFQAIVGTYEMTHYENTESQAFFHLYLFMMVIVMLNLLIAIMGNSYERVKESEEIEARKYRAGVIIEEEAMMLADGKCGGESACTLFPEFLEVLEALDRPKFAAEVAEEADGRERMHAETNEIAKGASTKEEVARVEAKVDAMNEKMTAEMAEMKAMMAHLVESCGVVRQAKLELVQ